MIFVSIYITNYIYYKLYNACVFGVKFSDVVSTGILWEDKLHLHHSI